MGSIQPNIISLETIDNAALVSKDPDEIARLTKSARAPGFFNVDFQSDNSVQILTDLPKVYQAVEEYFDQDYEVKMKDFIKDEELRYKYDGADESFEIQRDKLQSSNLVLPLVFAKHEQLLRQFALDCDRVVLNMLSCLSQNGGEFLSTHRPDQASATSLKFAYEPTKPSISDVMDNSHRDGGTLTLLFTKQWGIQVQHPETKVWSFVEPKDGCGLVNVADSLQKLSGQELHSCLHRVGQPVDGVRKRYYVMYFLRPEKATRLYM